jgi:hypothetical protein
MKTLFAAQLGAMHGRWRLVPLLVSFFLTASAGVVLGQTTLITVLGNMNAGGSTAPSGEATYWIGTNIQISATANSGWVFTGWSDGDTNSVRMIVVTASPITYTAYFVQPKLVLSPLVLRSDHREFGKSLQNRSIYLAAPLPWGYGAVIVAKV